MRVLSAAIHSLQLSDYFVPWIRIRRAQIPIVSKSSSREWESLTKLIVAASRMSAESYVLRVLTIGVAAGPAGKRANDRVKECGPFRRNTFNVDI